MRAATHLGTTFASFDLVQRLKPALTELLMATEYSQSAKCTKWDFAIEITTLQRMGLTLTDFRWLTRMSYVEHAREITKLRDDLRQFVPTGKLRFSRRSCFILTDRGAAFAHSLVSDQHRNLAHHFESSVVQPENIPTWDAQRRELRLNGHIVKQFKWPAVNQETILAAFQEEGWPPRIDDPLPPQSQQDPKRRLHDTIKCMNRNQKTTLVYFRGDGTGEGVLWEIVEHVSSMT